MTTRLLIAIFLCGGLCGQPTAKPAAFEVASIRSSAPGGHGCNLHSTFSNLQIRPTDCPLRTLISAAWSLAPWEMPEVPAAMAAAHYDINAKAAKPTSPRELVHMLQTLLEDRFRLRWHREQKQIPVYYLTVAKGGVKLKPTVTGSCVAWDHSAPPPPPMPGKPVSCDFILFPGTPDRLGMGMEGLGAPMSSIVGHLASLVGRPVIDNTGLKGIYDIHVMFARDSSLAFGGRAEQPGQASDPSGLPNIFTAIRSLGLNIAAGKGPVEVFVIDSVQRPSEN